jgi:hypothetical protein
MRWINTEVSTLRAPEFIGSTPSERGVWFCVLGYCIEQENGGCIKNASEWKDRQWQQTAGVTLREVRGAGRLLQWDGEDLLVMFYPVEKENEVRSKRVAGSSGGKASGKARSKQTGSNALSCANESASTERNGKERNTPIVPKGTENGVGSEVEPALELHPDSPAQIFQKKEKVGGGNDGAAAALERARGLFRMRAGTPLDSAQERAWRRNRAAVEATEEQDWLALEWWFTQGASSPMAKFRRKDLAQLLNHWNGEIERAHMEAHNSGAELSRGTRKRQVPDDWREIILTNAPDFNCPDRFEELPESIRAVVWDSVDQRQEENL